MKKIRIGLIGTGGICRGAHIPGYLKCDDCEITAICDIDHEKLKSVGDYLNLPEDARFTDYKELLASHKADAVDICTSNDVHVKIALAALDAGYPVSVEKPIGMNFEESLALEKKSRETDLPVFVCFSWRYREHPRYMKYLIDQGELGELYHIYINCVKDSGLWKGRRLEWRFQEERAGTGVLCDLGSHMFDMIRFFGEEFENVYCDRGIIVKRRQKLDSDEWADVTTDDWANVVCRLKSGIGADVRISRTVSTEKDTIEFYVIGSKGALRFIYENGKQRLLRCTGEDISTNSFKEVVIPDEFKTGGQIQSRSFIDLLRGHPDAYAAAISEGIYSQVAVDAAKLSSETGRAVKISELIKN
ncbi:MAG: Gfo/Idh/MocA family oxidoreductase [Clostridiales bacterium]|nr:Gfo/Idh/MocA family oxidoreductase [Clostridiales bacterium]